jgi:hypothetical protein
MGLASFKRDFEKSVAVVPPLPIFAGAPSGSADHIFERSADRNKSFRRQTVEWRKQMDGQIRELQRYLKAASADGDSAKLAYLVQDAIPRLISAIDEPLGRSIAAEESFKTELNALEMKHQFLAESADFLDFRDGILRTFRQMIVAIEDARAKVLKMLWDFDPDAHCGPSFETADELLSHLSR